MIERLKQIYSDYLDANAQPRKRTFADAFKGWLSGRGKGALPQDTRFADDVAACVAEIARENAPKTVFAAMEVLLSHPDKTGEYDQNLMLAAVHRNGLLLAPLLSAEEAAEALAMLDRVPKQYRFPVQKELKQKLQAQLQP